MRQAVEILAADGKDYLTWRFIEVRKAAELSQCDALIIPGGESTTISLVAASTGILEPLREFVKYVLEWKVEGFMAYSLADFTVNQLGGLVQA